MRKKRITKLSDVIVKSNLTIVTPEELKSNRCNAYKYLIK